MLPSMSSAGRLPVLEGSLIVICSKGMRSRAGRCFFHQWGLSKRMGSVRIFCLIFWKWEPSSSTVRTRALNSRPVASGG